MRLAWRRPGTGSIRSGPRSTDGTAGDRPPGHDCDGDAAPGVGRASPILSTRERWAGRKESSMRRSWNWSLVAVLLTVGIALGLGVGSLDAQQKNLLVSKKVGAPPPMDPAMGEAWKDAQPLTFKVLGGKNLPGGSTEVTLRSVYTGDTVYFLVQYKDPTESFRRGPWVKQADGSWQQLKDPDDKGGDNNKYYEDKMAMIWNISSPAFEARGCMAACHTGEGKPFGNKYLPNPGERADIWHWKSVRTGSVGQFDDQYLDATRYDKDKAPEAGRKSDPKTGGGYADNVGDDKKGPKWALPGNKPAPPYWIVDAEKTPLDDSKYKAGDEVPGIIVAPFTGDRGDISVKSAWKEGTWTLVFARRLVTGSDFDVQFNDMKKEYAFGVAVFDNAQVRHAYSPGVLKLRFE
ncbi:MAG: ethylbenzene dehydrogenase [Deltaproteobacteria bacterium]|nr:MAG: ethylbenzene dehydrogenase [Deltaproteobacteria bacterium]TMB18151.1 MAG: ethylbenzene dehydrogenase [Deltaproteobacteria bacterium]